jgi:hypothetical protein
MNIVGSLSRAIVEGFTNPGASEANRQPSIYTEALAALLAFILTVVIVSFGGMWLWNYSVVPLFEFARPAKSIFQILGLMVFIALVRP